MPYTVYNFDALTGGGTRALDAISVAALSNLDRAFGMVDGKLVPMLFEAARTDAEDTVNRPRKVRPDDYATAGVWVEQMVDGIPVAGGNLIINPQFDINQEGITIGTHGAGVYFRDQWIAGASGITASLSGDVLTITAGSAIQPIEDVNIPSGTYTLSWEGTAQAYIDGGSPQSSPHTFAISSGTHVEIEFGTGTVRQLVLVPGILAAPFLPRKRQEELLLCYRYFININHAVHRSGSTLFDTLVSFPVAMRTIPTVTQNNWSISGLYETPTEYAYYFLVSTGTSGEYTLNTDFDARI